MLSEGDRKRERKESKVGRMRFIRIFLYLSFPACSFERTGQLISKVMHTGRGKEVNFFLCKAAPVKYVKVEAQTNFVKRQTC